MLTISWVKQKAKKAKLIESGWALRKKLAKAGCTEGALMTSQLCHYFQANQAVHVAANTTTLLF